MHKTDFLMLNNTGKRPFSSLSVLFFALSVIDYEDSKQNFIWSPKKGHQNTHNRVSSGENYVLISINKIPPFGSLPVAE